MRLLFMVSRDDANPRAAGGDVMGSTCARYLAVAGHEVTYLTSSYPGAPGRETRDGVQVLRLGSPATLAWRLWRYYSRHGDAFDAVYAEAIGGSRVPFLAPLYVRRPLLAPWYQVNEAVFRHQFGSLRGLALARLERLLARLHRSATVLALTDSRRLDLLRLGFSPQQVYTVPPVGIEELPGGSPDPDSRSPLIVWLGKVRRYKCPHHCLEAMPAVLRGCPQARLVIAGRREDASYLRQLEATIRDLGIEGSVSFAFDLSEAAKRELLARAKVLAVPSPIEGFGIVVLEAGIVGTPAVASDGVPEEVVAHGYNGLRYPFGDRTALAEALISVLSSPALHEDLARNAAAHARSFTQPVVIAALEAALAHATGADARAEAPA